MSIMGMKSAVEKITYDVNNLLVLIRKNIVIAYSCNCYETFKKKINEQKYNIIFHERDINYSYLLIILKIMCEK